MKTFVIDTNVLLHDPQAITKFPGHQVVIPITVLDELDTKKRLRDELGRNARTAIALLEGLKDEGGGNLHDGVTLSNGSSLRIQFEVKGEKAPGLSTSIEGSKIISVAYQLIGRGEEVTFISKDSAARVRAEALGIRTDDYRYLKASIEEVHRPIRTLTVTKREIDLMFKDGKLTPPEGEEPFWHNEYCQFKSSEGSTVIGRYHEKNQCFELLAPRPKDLWGVKPLNLEQECALDLLLRDEVNLVTLVGPAGTGKTLLALAAALRKVFDEGTFARFLVTRPIVPLGKDIGYLPGTKEEKLYHWMQPIHDNLQFLCQGKGNEPTDTLRWIVESPKMEMEAVTYIRGRSLAKTFMIIDEAQNLTPHELKTVISRAGKGTKVVLTGDPSQIDNPYLDVNSNGLTYTVSRFKKASLFGHVYLDKTERSPLAALAAEVL